MKIIKKGTIPDQTKRFMCKYCGCVFECDSSEYEYFFDQKDGDFYKAKCPTCGTMTTNVIEIEHCSDCESFHTMANCFTCYLKSNWRPKRND